MRGEILKCQAPTAWSRLARKIKGNKKAVPESESGTAFAYSLHTNILRFWPNIRESELIVKTCDLIIVKFCEKSISCTK